MHLPHARAIADYGRVSIEARVASASPHGLVLLLTERLGLLAREARAAAEAGDIARRARATDRALAIVDGLDSTLDDARGGEVAQSLHALYALLRQRLMVGRADALEEAEAAATELARAWRRIAPDRV
jgi:flagellar protein FliS